MKKNNYEQIILIGHGRIAYEVLSYVFAKRMEYGFGILFIEYEDTQLNIIQTACNQKGIAYKKIRDKKELENFLSSVNKKTLIISVNNTFLFPEKIVVKRNIAIINFHNALLPKFPGRNAPSWAIYENEKETGITWHYVTSEVDKGNIIIQKKCEIGQDIKAYQLEKTLMNLAYEAFAECFEGIICESIASSKQPENADRRLYYSKEIPANGYFDMSDDPEYIYRLLRAVDYGVIHIFPPVVSTYNGRKIEILHYRKVDASKVIKKEGVIYLPYFENIFLEIKYRIKFNESK